MLLRHLFIIPAFAPVCFIFVLSRTDKVHFLDHTDLYALYKCSLSALLLTLSANGAAPSVAVRGKKTKYHFVGYVCEIWHENCLLLGCDCHGAK